MGFHEGSVRESANPIAIQRLGLVDYHYAWKKQQELATARAEGDIEDTLLIVEHPSTYTAGKRTQPEDLPQNDAPVIPVDRGGRITWHGPGQLVVYPVIKLADPLDVVDYVRRIEEAILQTCQSQGLDSVGRVEGRSGVWLPADSFDSPADSSGILRNLHTLRVLRPARKIAAIGIRISKKVTMHGLALNCNNTLDFYQDIVPCGLPDTGVTSLTQELGKDISPEDVEDTLISFLIDSFNGELPLSDLTIPEELAHEALHPGSSS